MKNGDSVKDFKQYCLENNILDDLFADTRAKIQKRGKPVKRVRKSEPFTFELYRGFDANLDYLELEGDKLVLSPKQSEQGMLWFTHMFINQNHHRAKDYVKGRGKWLLTYPLQATKHYDEVTYEDGSVERATPQDIYNKAEPTENSRYYCTGGMEGSYCLELPPGWYFTYKMEKFIGTTNKLAVPRHMITRNK